MARIGRSLRRRLPAGVSFAGMHKPLKKRLNWDIIEARPQKEGKRVVKGRNRRVVVVKSPDPKVFEQAIFIVREDFLAGQGKETDILKEAEKVADDYLKGAVTGARKTFTKLRPAFFAAGGAASVGLLWLVLHLFGV
jgi:hypothetical protein